MGPNRFAGRQYLSARNLARGGQSAQATPAPISLDELPACSAASVDGACQFAATSGTIEFQQIQPTRVPLPLAEDLRARLLCRLTRNGRSSLGLSARFPRRPERRTHSGRLDAAPAWSVTSRECALRASGQAAAATKEA